MNPSSSENPTGSDATIGAGDILSPDDNEQYKRKTIFFEFNIYLINQFSGLSVKERARMLTANPPVSSNDKKTTITSPSSNTTGK